MACEIRDLPERDTSWTAWYHENDDKCSVRDTFPGERAQVCAYVFDDGTRAVDVKLVAEDGRSLSFDLTGADLDAIRDLLEEVAERASKAVSHAAQRAEEHECSAG